MQYLLEFGPLQFKVGVGGVKHKPLILNSHPNHVLNLKTKSDDSTFHSSRIKTKSRISCSSYDGELEKRAEYKPNWVDDFFLNSFRNKLAQEVGWDSEMPGYHGLIQLINALMIGRTNYQINQASVRILKSLFPPFLLELYKMLITPIGGGRFASIMVARVTAVTCQWLMGPCSVNSINLPDGSCCQSGVFVERCKYLEESKCVGVCVNTCKLPTQAFFKDYMGIPLLMEPNFSDYSCQFSFGVPSPERENDSTLKEPCLEICPNASKQRGTITGMFTAKQTQCPKT